jgi:hypothetical protein
MELGEEMRMSLLVTNVSDFFSLHLNHDVQVVTYGTICLRVRSRIVPVLVPLLREAYKATEACSFRKSQRWSRNA